MPSKEKPYRVYRARRVRGPIEPFSPDDVERPSGRRGPDEREARAASAVATPPPVGPPTEPPLTEPAPLEPRRRRRRPRPTRRRWLRWTALGTLAVVLFFVAWGVAGYSALRGGVAQANERLPESARGALAAQQGSLLSSPATVLILGVDRGQGREGAGRADAIVLVRTDPDAHRLSLLSIPRDLRVEVPGYGLEKVNASYAFGGPALAVDTVEALTGIPVNHVVVVDFSSFGDVIDALGGITVEVPKRIVSNRFECPYSTPARCERWQGWRFEPGEQEMDGQRALVYARIRENALDPSESDITRGGRQQQVVQAIVDEVDGVGGFFRLPFVGKDVTKPLATDLSTGQLLELAWVKFRASSTLRCRLGGEASTFDGAAYLLGTEDNVAVTSMFLGESAPLPPRQTDGPFAPGCASD